MLIVAHQINDAHLGLKINLLMKSEASDKELRVKNPALSFYKLYANIVIAQ